MGTLFLLLKVLSTYACLKLPYSQLSCPATNYPFLDAAPCLHDISWILHSSDRNHHQGVLLLKSSLLLGNQVHDLQPCTQASTIWMAWDPSLISPASLPTLLKIPHMKPAPVPGPFLLLAFGPSDSIRNALLPYFCLPAPPSLQDGPQVTPSMSLSQATFRKAVISGLQDALPKLGWTQVPETLN